MNDATRFEILLPVASRRELAALAADTGLSSSDLVRLGVRWLLQNREVLLRPDVASVSEHESSRAA